MAFNVTYSYFKILWKLRRYLVSSISFVNSGKIGIYWLFFYIIHCEARVKRLRGYTKSYFHGRILLKGG